MLALQQLAEHQSSAVPRVQANGVSYFVRRLKADVLKYALHDGMQPPGTNVVHCGIYLLSHLQGSSKEVN